MDGERLMYVEEEKCVENFGQKSRREETTWKPLA